MPLLLDELAEPFRRLGADEARATLAEHWGIQGDDASRLDTERDDTFRSGDVTLKVAHPNDDPALLDLQSAAIEHARSADPGIPLQHVVPTLDGATSAVVDGRIARVLTWLPGELMLDYPVSVELLGECGRMQARLARALRDLEHPAADRALAWDIAQLPNLRDDTDDPLLLRVIDEFTADIAPALATLPHQLIHNDFHPGNVLIDPARPDAVAGILDFGDAVRTARVCDLGVALAYLLPEDGPLQPTIDTFVGGYCEVEPLLKAEVALVPHLIAARQAARLIVNAALHRGRTGGHEAPRVSAALHRILTHLKEGP